MAANGFQVTRLAKQFACQQAKQVSSLKCRRAQSSLYGARSLVESNFEMKTIIFTTSCAIGSSLELASKVVVSHVVGQIVWI